ncbi:MAG: hypothetical protein PVI33_04760 [Candidatus Omnitrophota bacterium]|jgi:hypothetical protein
MSRKSIRKIAKTKKGSRYTCYTCGLIVTVDKTCGCVDACDIICCGKEMKPKS